MQTARFGDGQLEASMVRTMVRVATARTASLPWAATRQPVNPTRPRIIAAAAIFRFMVDETLEEG